MKIISLVVSVVFLVFFAACQKPSVYCLYEINSSPTNFMAGDPNLNVLPKHKKIQDFRFVYVSDQIDEKKYWEKFGDGDAIVTVSDYSGFDGKGKKSIIFSNKKPDLDFFENAKNIKEVKWQKK
jgi:hypothetical protein